MRDFSAVIIELLTPKPEYAERRWERAESEVGAGVPEDYKALVAGLGGASILDDCLCLFEPDSRETHSDFANLVAERDSVWQYLKDRGRRTLPEKYFNEDVRLIPFALVEANVFYWIAISGRPESEWRVLFVDVDMEDWLEFDLSAAEFIHGLLVGRITHPNFDEYFTDSFHSYSRL